MKSEHKNYPSCRAALALSILIAALASAALASVALAQNRQQPQVKPPAQPAATPEPPPNILVSPDEDYRLGPADVIEIQVEDAPEVSGKFHINANGTFTLYYIGRVSADNKTTEELEKLIADGLRGRYLVNPRVHISVLQINSRSFFIQGAVRRPGVYQIEGRTALLKLITVAGGLAENHGSTAFIIHEVKPKRADSPGGAPGDGVMRQADAAAEQAPDYVFRSVNINGLFKGLVDNNMYIEPGDIVNIPVLDVFFVAGEVNSPGQFPLKEGTTLRQAIALAQGTTFNSAPADGVIFRDDPATGKRQEIKVDINAVMKNRREDITLQANDIVIVPNSRFKTVGNAVLKAFGLGTAQRGPYRY